MSKTLDLTKPVQTRGGRPVRVLCTDAKGDEPIVALVLCADGSESAEMYSADGSFLFNEEESGWDLVNIEEPS